MNEEGGSPGGGSAPPPAVPPASTAATPPVETAIPVSQLKAVVSEAFGELRNGLFADLRKAGALGKEKPSAESPATPTPPSAAAPAQTGLSMADVEAMLEQDRAITRAQIEHKLNDAQVRRMKSALKADKPEDVGTWATAYLSDMGLVRTETPTTTTTTASTPALPGGPPISDKGSPAPGGVTNWEREFADNPLGMSEAARALMDAKHGTEKARRMRIEAAQRQGERISVVANPQR